MKNLIFASLIAMTSVNVFAENELEDIARQNPGASNKEVLKMFYEASTMPAEISDFDTGEYDPRSDYRYKQTCRLVIHSDPQDNLATVYIYKLKIPGNGPLFPGPTETKLIITQDKYYYLNDNVYKDFYYATEMGKNSSDLIAQMSKTASHSHSPFKLLMRKNGELISFKVLTYKNGVDNGPLFNQNVDESFGYCWRK